VIPQPSSHRLTTQIWEYKFINTHATYTMSITDNSGIGITYKARG
jgi:hypothetical protein